MVYQALITQARSLSRKPNGCRSVLRSVLKPLVHKLLHAAETYPLGRQWLHYLLQALHGGAVEIEEDVLLLPFKADEELGWWERQFALGEWGGVPLASRFSFPATSSDDTVVYYGDAARELEDPAKVSGYGAWSVIRGVFYYFYGLWTLEELLRFSINVLEAKVRDMALYRFVQHARELGCSAAHVLAFSDNTAAECTAEAVRTHSQPLNALLRERQQWCADEGVFVATERCASVDNTLADWLSRGDVQDVLRVVKAAGLEAVELQVDGCRDMSTLPSSALAA